MRSSIIDSLGLSSEPAEESEPAVVTATVASATRDVALLRTSGTGVSAPVDAVMPVTEFYPNERWKAGDTYHLLQLGAGPRPVLSAVRDELLVALLDGISPEVRSGAVRVMGVARQPGVRAKVAVAATEPGVDPIAACVGKGANRVRLLGRLLHGERVDIIAWHPEPETYLRNALAPAAVSGVDIDGDRATAYAPPHLMSAAVGGGGLNSQLAGQLVGLIVTIAPEGA